MPAARALIASGYVESIAGHTHFRIWLLTLLLATGCQAPLPPTTPTSAVLEIPDYDRFIDSTLTVLRETDFHPQVVDRTHGVILTGRTTGAQWFEFWRSDVQGGYQALESSVVTIGRSVTVTISPAAGETGSAASASVGAMGAAPAANSIQITQTEGSTTAASAFSAPQSAPTTQEYVEPPPRAGRFVVTVDVEKYRLSQPDRQITTTAGAMVLYSERAPTTEGIRGKPSKTDYWIPLGRDGLCEEHLLNRMIVADPQVARDRTEPRP